MDNPQAKFSPLHTLVNSDIFDVTYFPQSSDELLLDENTSNANDLVCQLVDNDKGKVGIRTCTESIESGSVVCKRNLGGGGEDRENREMRACKICFRKGSYLTMFFSVVTNLGIMFHIYVQIRSKLSFHFARNQFRREKKIEFGFWSEGRHGLLSSLNLVAMVKSEQERVSSKIWSLTIEQKEKECGDALLFASNYISPRAAITYIN